jgi:hypothetical protein
MRRDTYSHIDVVRALSPITQTDSSSAIVGSIVDTLGASGVTFAIAYGALTDTNATFAVTLDEGDVANLSDAAAVSSADVLIGTLAACGAAAASDDNKVAKLGYLGRKRYLRLTITPTGNDSGNAPVSAVAILSRQRVEP